MSQSLNEETKEGIGLQFFPIPPPSAPTHNRRNSKRGRKGGRETLFYMNFLFTWLGTVAF